MTNFIARYLWNIFFIKSIQAVYVLLSSSVVGESQWLPFAFSMRCAEFVSFRSCVTYASCKKDDSIVVAVVGCKSGCCYASFCYYCEPSALLRKKDGNIMLKIHMWKEMLVNAFFMFIGDCNQLLCWYHYVTRRL